MFRGLEDFQNGQVLLVNKPLTWTSFDVVNRIRIKITKHFGIKKIKIGHAGTLDPLATGLLIICTGKFTSKLETFQGQPKRYTGTITLGQTTPSFDLETLPEGNYPTDHISATLVEEKRKFFLGKQAQIPPIFSAVKKDGQRLFKKARKGEMFTPDAREIEIYQFDILYVDLPLLHFDVLCSKGTYIRSLASDFGKAVESGGYLSTLCRTAIGDYQLQNAWELSDLLTAIEGLPTLPPAQAAPPYPPANH
ncbi:MAG: tRNA pseudouridine(55) synthase TruB [Saprospiraceae bacterium]|nr:tRNA pseudouridine(55) synthase TruB [Saprospiraceae bacterium]